MKNIGLICLIAAYLLVGCAKNNTKHDHAHDETCTHDHDHSSEHSHEHAHEHDEEHNHEHDGEHSHDHDHDNAHAHDHASGSENPDEVVFPPEKAQAVGLKTIVLEAGDFKEVIKTSGHIQSAQGDESVLVATVNGVVKLGRLPFLEGTSVHKGQAVLSLTSSNLADGDIVVRTRSAYELAKKEFERAEALVDSKIVSAKEFEQAKTNYEQAKAAYDAISTSDSGSGISVSSPISGYIKNIQVNEGEYVTVGQPLATISQNKRLVLRAEVAEKYYHKLSRIRTANFYTPYDKKVYNLTELNGRVLSYGKSTGETSFYVPVNFEFDNRGDIVPGSYVEVYLQSDPIANVLSLPVSSLVEIQGTYFVFVRLDEECFRKQEVSLGMNDGQHVQILSGVHAGDEVVTEAAYQLRLASVSGVMPAHTHNH